MPTIKINYEELEYDNIIYVDAENGSDSDGDGSEDNPYKTLGKALDEVTSDNNEAIYLKNTGNYYFDKTGTWYDVCGHYIAGVDLIGEQSKIIIEDVADNLGTDYGTDKPYFDHINFYNIIFEVSSDFPLGNFSTSDDRFTVFFEHSEDMYFKFYNCVFTDSSEKLTEYFFAFDYSSSKSPNYIQDWSNFENCLFELYCDNLLKIMSASTSENILIKNCVTNLSEWCSGDQPSIETSLTEVEFDSEYNITSDDEWEYEGTGENPDGSQAHIGVYGGKYAWGDWLIVNLDKPKSGNALLLDEQLIISGNINYNNNNNIKYKIETQDSSGNVLSTLKSETDWLSVPVDVYEEYTINEEILNNNVVITAWDDMTTTEKTVEKDMEDEGTLGSGNMWSATIDLNEYISVDKIELLL